MLSSIVEGDKVGAAKELCEYIRKYLIARSSIELPKEKEPTVSLSQSLP